MVQARHERLDAIQILRAIAALAVVFGHALLELSRYTSFDPAATWPILTMGRAGVDLFFVISGFVMVYVSADHFAQPNVAWRFILRRIARVVPVYWFYTTIVLIVGLLAPKLFRGLDLSPLYIIASYLFVPMASANGDKMHPLLGLGWTLNYEMFFYVLFAPMLFLKRANAIVVLAAVFLALVLVGTFLQPTDGALWFWSRSIILEFVSGSLLAILYLRGWRHGSAVAAILTSLALIWLLVTASYWNRGGPDVRLFVTGVPAILIVAGIIMTRTFDADWRNHFISRIFLLLGDASYSLYLVHMFVIRALTKLLPVDALGGLYPYLFLFLTISISAAIAIMSYRMIEQPSNQMMRRWLSI